jgi:hypothetical protein
MIALGTTAVFASMILGLLSFWVLLLVQFSALPCWSSSRARWPPWPTIRTPSIRWDDATGENVIEQIAKVGDYMVARRCNAGLKPKSRAPDCAA